MDSSSIESTRRESAWRRGWSDTMTAVASPQFKLGETIVALLMAMVTGLLTGPAFGSWQGSLVALGAGAGAAVGALLGFAVLLLWNYFRAPIRQRNEAWSREQQAWDRERQREQLRPEIGAELEARVIPDKGTGEASGGSKRHLLKVTNRSGETISDYYAQFREFRNPYNQTIDDLEEYELYWYRADSDLPEKRTSISSGKPRYIHLFTTVGSGLGNKGDKLWIARVVNGEYNLWHKKLNPTISPINPTDIYRGYYTVILEIGSSSEKVSVPPVDVELKIKYHGTHSLSAEIRAEPHIDIGPPEPDRTGLS